MPTKSPYDSGHQPGEQKRQEQEQPDQYTPTLLQRVEDELGVSLSSSVKGEDSELERRLDTRRIMRTRDRSTDHSKRVCGMCDGLISIVQDMEDAHKEVERLTRAATAKNPLEIAGWYVWNRVTGKKPKSLDDCLLAQVGNVRRFNASLSKLITAARTQLDASTREYAELTEAYEIVDARQRQYQPVLEELQALYGDFDRHVQETGHGNPDYHRHEAGRRLFGIKVGELRQAMRKYATQHEGVEETIATHVHIEDHLRAHLHLWEDLYAFSVPYERRVAQLQAMAPQVVAQQGVMNAMRSAVVLFASYLEGLHARMEGKLLDTGEAMTPSLPGYGSGNGAARKLLGE